MRTIGLIFFLFAWGCIVEHVAGCGPTAVQRTENAIVVATYERELEHCLQQGKASGSYAVYEACARSVDRTLCMTRGLRCVDGGAQ